MVPMGVGEEDLHVPPTLAQQLAAEAHQTAAAIDDQHLATASDLKTCGIATKLNRGWARHGDAATRAPKPDREDVVVGHRAFVA